VFDKMVEKIEGDLDRDHEHGRDRGAGEKAAEHSAHRGGEPHRQDPRERLE
jgi:hypothetical protein